MPEDGIPPRFLSGTKHDCECQLPNQRWRFAGAFGLKPASFCARKFDFGRAGLKVRRFQAREAANNGLLYWHLSMKEEKEMLLVVAPQIVLAPRGGIEVFTHFKGVKGQSRGESHPFSKELFQKVIKRYSLFFPLS